MTFRTRLPAIFDGAIVAAVAVVHLVVLPDVYGVGPRAVGGPGIALPGEWRFDNLWLEGVLP